MAYVGTIALNDRHGDTLVSKRVTAMPGENATELMNRLGLEVLHVRAQRPDLPLTVVQDGAPELTNGSLPSAKRSQAAPVKRGRSISTGKPVSTEATPRSIASAAS